MSKNRRFHRRKIATVEAYLHGELGTTEAVQRYKISTATYVPGGLVTSVISLPS